MEELLNNMSWLPTLVAFVASFALGWAWYSPMLFLKPWQEGIGEPTWRAPMWMPMATQAFGTLLLSMVVGLAVAGGHVLHAVLMGLAIVALIKSNGLYCGKTKKAITVEASYIVAMVLLMIAVHMVL